MDDTLYLLVILLMTVFILFYGGHNSQELIEYNAKDFDNLHNISIFEQKLQKYNTIANFNNSDHIDISDYIKHGQKIIPNYIGAYFVNIKKRDFFSVHKLFDNNIFQKDELIMITYNHNNENNLELLVKIEGTIGYFYDMVNQISITGFFDLYNNSDNDINVTIFILKKPFWFS